MVKIAICDDDRELASQLKAMILDIRNVYGEEIDVQVILSGSQLYEEMEYEHLRGKQKYDVIFLDIAMPQMNGIDVGDRIRNELDDNITQIIYISSQTSYAMELFHIHPMDFLVKPFQQEQVAQVMDRSLKMINRGQQQFSFVTGRGKELTRIPISEILYFQSMARKVIVHTSSHNYEFYGKLIDIFGRLEHYRFFFIHKSYLVNYSQVQRMTYDQVKMTDGTILQISPSKRKEVRNVYMQYENIIEG